MITLKDYLMGREIKDPPNDQLLFNANQWIDRVNLLLERFGKPKELGSGYRPAHINAATPGASLKSTHITCEGGDLEDIGHELWDWCEKNQDVLKEFGLYMEHKKDTPTWCHLQTRAVKSGKRVFFR